MFKLYFIFCLTIILSGQVLADRCDTLYSESCETSSKPLPDATGLLGGNTNIRDRRKLYRDTIQSLRLNFRKLLNTDPEIKSKYAAATFFNKNDCVTLNCVPPTPAQKFEIAFQYFSQSVSYLNPDPPADPTNNSYINASFSVEDMALLDGPKFKAVIHKSEEELYAKVAPNFQRDYIHRFLFPGIKNTALKVIDRLPDGPEKDAFRAKIKATTLTINDCDLGLLEVNAFYDKGSINYCYSMMYSSMSTYSELFTIAHELGHSIDPCSMPSQSDAWRGVISCLRSPSSMGAQIQGKPSTSTSCSLDANDKDQIGESFADWFATEITSDLTNHLTLAMKTSNSQTFSNGMSNALRSVCSQYISPDDQAYFAANPDEHPANRARLDLITAQPQIRARMGCSAKSKKTYCELNPQVPEHETGGPDEHQSNPSER